MFSKAALMAEHASQEQETTSTAQAKTDALCTECPGADAVIVCVFLATRPHRDTLAVRRMQEHMYMIKGVAAVALVVHVHHQSPKDIRDRC